MALITVKCPTCGESFQADTSRQFAFCIYCGAKVELGSAEVMEDIIEEKNTEFKDTDPQAVETETVELPSAATEEAAIVGKAPSSEQISNGVRYMSREEFERKKRFERRCNEVIAFFSDQMAKPDKKIVNTRTFFNDHMTEWQEAQYRVQKELKDVEIKDE